MVEHNIPNIFCEALKNARIAKGMEINELANTLCLSTKHIRQLEEGGDSVFFSKSHKVQVAKKVGAYLGLSEDQVIEGALSPSSEILTKYSGSSEEVDKLEKNGQVTDPQKGEGTIIESESKKHNGLFIALAAVLIAYFANSYFNFGDMLTSSEQTKSDQVKTEVSAPEVKVQEVPAAKVELASTVCDIVPQNVPSFRAPKANSVGNFVYLVSRDQQTICVIDAKNNKQLIELADLEKRNIVGSPPFTILSPDFKKLDVYYQGWKVQVQAGATTIKTEEQSTKIDPPSVKDSSNTDQK